MQVIQGNSDLSKLDELYGPPIIPNRTSWAERNSEFGVHSAIVIKDTASLPVNSDLVGSPLGDLMSTQFGRGTEALATVALINWLIDTRGNLHIGFEEFVDLNTGELITIKLRSGADAYPSIVPGIGRVGHPGFINGGKARIGGELYFDASDANWHLSNFSGRYGWPQHREEKHLLNAGRLFSQLGLPVTIDYTPYHAHLA